MDKSKAIELLKQCLNEVPKLRELHHDNQDFVLWFDNARNIIKAALTPDDLKRFSFAQPIFSNDFRGGSVYKSTYLAKLTGYETALKSILQKYELPGIKEKPATTAELPPKAFIAHEGMTGSLQKIKDLLDALGVKYLIAEIEPSDGRVIERQVQWTPGKADVAIILATKGKVINKDTGKPYMGMNVADELGRAREVFKNRIILLLQKGVEPHTNISGIVYEPFTPQNREKAFIKIIKELRNWGFIVVSQ